MVPATGNDGIRLFALSPQNAPGPPGKTTSVLVNIQRYLNHCRELTSRLRDKVGGQQWVTPENYPFSQDRPNGLPLLDWMLNADKGFVAYFRPRCGSTSLAMWFFANMGYHLRGVSVSAFRQDWVNHQREQLERVLDERWDSLHKFLVVRNPFDRAVSSYLHTVNYPGESQQQLIRQHLGEDTTPMNLSFRGFVRFLQHADFDSAASIWRRQSSLSCWERGGVDDLVRLERMNEYLLALNRRYGFRHAPTYNSVTVPEGEQVVRHGGANVADVPFCDLLAYRKDSSFQSFPEYGQFYDQQLRQDVATLYAEDLTLYENADLR